MPAAPSSRCPRPRPASGVRCPVRATSVHACCPRDRCPVSVRASARPGVCCPASGVGVRCLCVAVSAVSGRKKVLERGGGAGSRMAGMAGVGVVAGCVHARLVVCLSRRLVSMLAQALAGPAERRFGPGRRRGRWLGSASSTAWPTRTGRVHARIIRWWEPVRGEARLLRQADRCVAGESLGRSCRVEPNIKKPIGHIPLAKPN